jgi:hypothetical protein
VGTGVGAGVGTGVGLGVGTGVGTGVGLRVGAGVGLGVGTGVGLGVGTGVGAGVTAAGVCRTTPLKAISIPCTAASAQTARDLDSSCTYHLRVDSSHLSRAVVKCDRAPSVTVRLSHGEVHTMARSTAGQELLVLRAIPSRPSILTHTQTQIHTYTHVRPTPRVFEGPPATHPARP